MATDTDSDYEQQGFNKRGMTTETNLYPDMLANEMKLKSEAQRWYPGGDDDNLDSYTKPNTGGDVFVQNNSTHQTQSAHHTDKSEHYSQSEGGNGETKKTSLDGDDYDSLSSEEQMLRKLDMLRKLGELAQAGVKLSQNYNMNSDYRMMKYEYELHKGIRAKQNSINWLSSMTLNAIYGLEMLNDKYNPFDLKLKGWSEQMNADIGNYYDVFGELYEKYNQPGKGMAPEVKLLLMVSGSALKFHLSNTVLSQLPSANVELENNPQLREQLRNKALQQNMVVNNKVQEEHNVAAQKVADLHFIKEKELEMLKQQQEIAYKQQQLEQLRQTLQSQSQRQPQVQQQRPQQTQQSQISQQVPQQRFAPVVPPQLQARMAIQPQGMQMPSPMKKQDQDLEVQRLMEQKRLAELQAQEQLRRMQQMQELQKLREQREMLERQSLAESEVSRRSRTNSKASKTSKTSKSSKSSKSINLDTDDDNASSASSIIINPKFSEILKNAKKNISNTSEDKVIQEDIIDNDEISKASISLGSRKSKNSVNKKKTNISIS